MGTGRVIRALVVDDSAFMRSIISRILAAGPDIEVVGTARDGIDGLSKAAALNPDVITLDIEMPRMNGLEMLRQLMATDPRPVIIVSSISQPQAEATMRAFQLGAVDVVTKPSGTISLDMHVVGEELIRKARAAATISGSRLVRRRPAESRAAQKAVAEHSRLSRLIVIGSSTGGPGALGQVLPQIAGGLNAGVIVVQHMPPGFTKSLAKHLDQACSIHVREASDGDVLVDGACLVAPGGSHLVFDGKAVRLDLGPTRHGVRPAVDVTLESLPESWCGSTVIVIMTGMGMDGAAGSRYVKKNGGLVVAQDEASSVVYGMPRAVAEMGLCDHIIPLEQIGNLLNTISTQTTN